jgi:2-isopropylmalate synthase
MAEAVVRIFDTTLRDGEQSPGVSLNLEEKLEIARQLERLGVDVIEAGFPVTSPGDMAAVRAIAAAVRTPVVCALARTRRGDVEAAARALEGAARPRIHTFTSGSRVHLEHMLRMTEQQALEAAVDAVRHARRFVADVEFSAQDVARSDPGFLERLYVAAVEAGATVVNVPDTVGYTTPREFAEIVAALGQAVHRVNPDVCVSVHTHDDLGLAVANALAGVEAGATQVECAVNGIGERAGNCSLEEVVMALVTRRDHFRRTLGIRTEELYRTSQLVSKLTGMVVQPNKAIVGANAFAHEAGIHQDGVLKERTTYEIMRPEDVGVPASRLVLGKHSGRHALRERLQSLGFHLGEAEFERAFARFKELADRKRGIADADLAAIVQSEVVAAAPEICRLVYFHVTAGSDTVPTATVRVALREGEPVLESATGDGPVDAVYRAIDRALGQGFVLADYALRAVTGGQDALGEVTVRLADAAGRTATAMGTSTDVLEASARAYVAAVNKLLALQDAAAGQGAGVALAGTGPASGRTPGV